MNIPERTTLTIRVGENSLSFSTPKRSDDGRIDFEPYHIKAGISMAANLRQAFGKSRLLSMDFTDAVVVVDSPVLLVPIEEYEENDICTLYTHAYKRTVSSTVLHSVLPGQNAVAAFAVNSDLKLVVSDNFRSSTFMPLMQPVWNYLHKRSFTGSRNKLFAYFHDRKVDVVSFRQNRFRFSNNFEADRCNDVVYYLLYVWKQLGYDVLHDELHIAGTPSEHDGLMEMLRRYVKNVHEINPAADLGFSITESTGGVPLDLQILHTKGR